jgi:hypothetical protein
MMSSGSAVALPVPSRDNPARSLTAVATLLGGAPFDPSQIDYYHVRTKAVIGITRTGFARGDRTFLFHPAKFHMLCCRFLP